MTPELTIRSFTNDQYVLDKVFYSNFYGLKNLKDHKDFTVLDIGAHCGYFSFAALALGASKIYCFEPFLENFKILLKNVENVNIGKVIPHQVGVYTESLNIKFSYPKPENGILNLTDFNIDSAAGKTYTIPCITLDEILMEYIEEEKVDLLKISIGYAENTILEKSNTLFSKVKNICGEVLIEEGNIDSFKNNMKLKGYIDSFFIKNQEEEGKYLFIFSQEKCENIFNIKPST